MDGQPTISQYNFIIKTLEKNGDFIKNSVKELTFEQFVVKYTYKEASNLIDRITTILNKKRYEAQVKVHLCQICGENNPENFTNRSKSKCKSCYYSQ